MSIQSEITRLSGNISDSLDAVAAKGVQVPTGSTSDDLATLIAQIPTGGGSGMVIVETPDEHGGTIMTITGEEVVLQSKTATPSTSSQVIAPDEGYTGLSQVTVSAMPSGTAGTPTASKGTVSNHQVSVTPSVTNTAGYITGGTKSGTAVTVSASELVSGTYAVTGSGTKDVTNYASISVPAGTAGTPTASKGTVSNHSVTVTPSVTNSAGYIAGGTKSGTGVTVSVAELESGTKSITANGTGISVSGYSTVNVAVPSSEPSLQTKTATPVEAVQVIEPDSGYDGLSAVTVEAVSSSYVGSGITRRSSSSLTASGATVTVPAGYYESQASKSVDTMTLPTLVSSSPASGYTEVATLDRRGFVNYLNIPPGYNTAGAYYKFPAIPDGSVTAPFSATASGATVTIGTDTVTFVKDVSVTPRVTTAGYISSGTAGNMVVSLSANLVIQHYYTGSSAPSSSTGVNGDIYLQTS